MDSCTGCCKFPVSDFRSKVTVPQAQKWKRRSSQDSGHTAATRFFLAAMNDMVSEHKFQYGSLETSFWMSGVLILQAEGFPWPGAAQRTSFASPENRTSQDPGNRSYRHVSGPAHVSDTFMGVQISGELDMTARRPAHDACAWPSCSADLELVCQTLGDELKGPSRIDSPSELAC